MSELVAITQSRAVALPSLEQTQALNRTLVAFPRAVVILAVGLAVFASLAAVYGIDIKLVAPATIALITGGVGAYNLSIKIQAQADKALLKQEVDPRKLPLTPDQWMQELGKKEKPPLGGWTAKELQEAYQAANPEQKKLFDERVLPEVGQVVEELVRAFPGDKEAYRVFLLTRLHVHPGQTGAILRSAAQDVIRLNRALGGSFKEYSVDKALEWEEKIAQAETGKINMQVHEAKIGTSTLKTTPVAFMDHEPSGRVLPAATQEMVPHSSAQNNLVAGAPVNFREIQHTCEVDGRNVSLHALRSGVVGCIEPEAIYHHMSDAEKTALIQEIKASKGEPIDRSFSITTQPKGSWQKMATLARFYFSSWAPVFHLFNMVHNFSKTFAMSIPGVRTVASIPRRCFGPVTGVSWEDVRLGIARQRAKASLESGFSQFLERNPEAKQQISEGVSGGEAVVIEVPYDHMVVSLLTPLDVDHDRQKEMVDSERAALASFNGPQTFMMRNAQGEPVQVKVKVQTHFFNTLTSAQNYASRQNAEQLKESSQISPMQQRWLTTRVSTSGWENQKEINKEGWLGLQTETPVGEIKGLSKEQREEWLGKLKAQIGNNGEVLENYETSGNPYAAAGRMMLLGYLMGYGIQAHCKSGKDRTAMAIIEMLFLLECLARTGELPPVDDKDLTPEQAKIYLEVVGKSGGDLIARENAGKGIKGTKGHFAARLEKMARIAGERDPAAYAKETLTRLTVSRKEEAKK